MTGINWNGLERAGPAVYLTGQIHYTSTVEDQDEPRDNIGNGIQEVEFVFKIVATAGVNHSELPNSGVGGTVDVN